MISFDFEYYRPDTIEEATTAYSRLMKSGSNPIYYNGGTEILSLARNNQLDFRAVIDLKNIPECQMHESNENQIVLGASLTLNQICEKNLFPLMTAVLKLLTDHTSRNKITLGGNVCGTIHYREAVLPLLVSEAKIVAAGLEGTRTVPVTEIIDQKIQLEDGEFLVQFLIDKEYSELPYKNVKKTKSGETDYPLISIAALKKNTTMRFAFSGLYPYPIRSMEMENKLNDLALSFDERVDAALSLSPEEKLNDILGSAEYREFIASNLLKEFLMSFGA